MADSFHKVCSLLSRLTPLELKFVADKCREMGGITSSAERMRRYRAKHRDEDSASHVTPPVTPRSAPPETNGHVTGDATPLLTPPSVSKKGNLSEKDQQIRETAIQVLQFLNGKRVGKRPFPFVEGNLENIVARLKEGYPVEDLKSVIAKKWREWGGNSEMEKYARPATLFGPKKFAMYVAELGVGEPPQTGLLPETHHDTR